MILCEKPLSMDGPEGVKMVQAVEKAGVPNMVWYNYRRVPAVTLAKQLIDEGRLGRIFHYRAKFLQDWTISKDLPQGGAGLWRLDVKVAGSGVTGDLLAHCIDTALWLNGSIDKVNAMTETFIKERKHNLTGKVEKVGIDDACAFLARFKNGSLATFESTRYARGHKALYTFEINGENASIFWDLHDLHRLQYFDHRDEGRVRGWRTIHVTDGDHPYMEKWWVPGLQIGYEHSFVHQVADFLEGVAKGKPASPTSAMLETQYVCDAVLKSAKTGRWGRRCRRRSRHTQSGLGAARDTTRCVASGGPWAHRWELVTLLCVQMRRGGNKKVQSGTREHINASRYVDFLLETCGAHS